MVRFCDRAKGALVAPRKGKSKNPSPPLDAVPGTSYESALREDIRTLQLILESKVLFEAEGDFGPPLVVVVTGGTNVGKSEVFNALIETPVALPDPRAGMTRRPGIYAHATTEARLSHPAFLPGAEVEILHQRSSLNASDTGEDLKAFLWPHEADRWRNAAVIDSPDIDSNRAGNQAWAVRLAAAADVVLFVTSPSKYNDEVCVEFLARALRMGKHVVVAFNLLDDRSSRALEDFTTHVWKGLDAPAPVLVELPLASGEVGKAVAEPLKRVRKKVLQMAKDPSALKREMAGAAFRYFADGAREVVEVLRREGEAVEAIRTDLDGDVEKAKTEYRRRLEGQEFLELEEVFREVLKTFRVPVIDDVLGAPRNLFLWARSRLSGGRAGATLEEKIQVRRASDLQWIKEQVETVRLGLLSRLSGGGGRTVEEVVGARLREGGFDRLPHARVEEIVRRGDGEIDAWIRETREEIVASIEGHPYLKQFLKSARVLLQVGTGVLVAVLTGGFGSADLVLGPAAATFAQYFIEMFGSAYFNDKRRTYTELQLNKFANVARAALAEPFDTSLPDRPEGFDLQAVETGLAEFEKTFKAP
jgi:hypothetical protein